VVQDYSSETDVKCNLDKCKTYPVITDLERGEILCGGCGLVLLQNIPDLSYENHGYTNEEFMTQTRTGPATSLTMHDQGLSTVIGSDIDSCGNKLSSKAKVTFSRLREWDKRSKSRSTSSLSKAFTILNGMKTKLAIPDNVVEKAAYIYRKAVTAKLTRGRTMTSLIAASLYAACRETNTPRTLDDIVEVGNVERRILSRDLRTLIKKLSLSLNQYDTSSFVIKIANNLQLKEKTKRNGLDILKKAQATRITSGKHPVALAAASLYIACMLNDEKISQKRFSEAANVSDVTIRTTVSVLRKTLRLAEDN
jgi:transcription initiation factor TFIIB